MSENFGEIELVLKGGQPWGFKLRANSDKCSAVIVDEIVFGEKADQQGELKVGDHLLKINGIQCLSLADAQQLIDSAFRTLTILVWRSRESFEDDIYLAPNSLQKCGRKSNYVPCQPFFKCVSALSIYKDFNDVVYEEQLLPSKEKSSVETNAYKGTMKTLQTSISTYSNNFQMSANKMTVFCAPNLQTSKNSESSNFSPEFCKGPRSIHYCKEKPTLKGMYLKDMPNLKNKRYFTHSPTISKHNLKLNSVISHCNQSLISSIQIQKSAVISGTLSENMYHCSKNNIPVSKHIESCCMYPNCHNKHMNCKIHCLPERDIAHPMDQLIKKNNCNSKLLYAPDSKYSDQIDILLVRKNPYEDDPANSSSEYLLNEYQVHHKNIKQKNIKSLNLNDELNISTSNIHTEFEFKKATTSNISEPISNSQSMHLKRKDQHSSSPNHFSFCYFDDIFYKNLHAKSESTLSPNYVNVDELQKNVIFNQLSQNSSVQVKETNKHTLHSCTNSLSIPTSSMRINKQTFFDYKQFDEPHNSSATKENEKITRLISLDAEEDDELCLIEKNKVSCYTTPSSSAIGSPPLPPPPCETEIEIIPSDVTLPPPPFFFNENDCPKANKMGSITETIYENLEMVQIHCSVVNSSTQTTLDKQTHFFTESSEVLQNGSLQIKKASPYLERKDMSPRKCTQSKLQSSSFFMKSMLYDQNEKSSKSSLSLPLTSAYFTTSTPKAKFLTRYTSKVHLKNEAIGNDLLSNKKEELMSSITSKVDILLQEQASLQEEMQQNDELGCSLMTKLEKCAKLNEVGKFKVHIEELEKITNLLLSLSGRLARTKSALLILPSDASTEEKNLLEEKLCKLNQQYNEAVYLQENINQRSNQISYVLNKYLTEEECSDYKHFIKMKVKLLMDYKELVEKIKLGKEQLSALKSSIKTMDMY